MHLNDLCFRNVTSGLLNRLHNSPRFLTRPRQRRQRRNRLTIPGVVQGSGEGPRPLLQNVLHVVSDKYLPRINHHVWFVVSIRR